MIKESCRAPIILVRALAREEDCERKTPTVILLADFLVPSQPGHVRNTIGFLCRLCTLGPVELWPASSARPEDLRPWPSHGLVRMHRHPCHLVIISSSHQVLEGLAAGAVACELICSPEYQFVPHLYDGNLKVTLILTSIFFLRN